MCGNPHALSDYTVERSNCQKKVIKYNNLLVAYNADVEKCRKKTALGRNTREADFELGSELIIFLR
jgi:hypothetical protein